MCEPTTLAVLSIASTAASVYGQQQAANAQEKANWRQYENTMRAYANNSNQVNLEQQQIRENAIQKKTENNMMARSAIAKSAVSAGENGVSGLSVDALLSDLAGKQNRYNSSVDTNYDYSSMALDNQRQNIYANAASTINGLKTPAMPDYLSAGLKIGQTYYQGKKDGAFG